MTSNQYRSAIERLGLSQVKAGKFLGVDARTSRRWALDETPIPHAVSLLLKLMLGRGIKPEELK